MLAETDDSLQLLIALPERTRGLAYESYKSCILHQLVELNANCLTALLPH